MGAAARPVTGLRLPSTRSKESDIHSRGEEDGMPTYITLIKWTDQGREKVQSLPDRVQEVEKRLTDHGATTIGNWVTMGRYDQIAVNEAPDDETAAKLALMIAGRGNAITETLRAFGMDEVRGMLQG
jgi:uncharacterized protein with GYD domain